MVTCSDCQSFIKPLVAGWWTPLLALGFAAVMMKFIPLMRNYSLFQFLPYSALSDCEPQLNPSEVVPHLPDVSESGV